MKYDFDTPIDRFGRHSVKWEFFVEGGMRLVPWDRTRPEPGKEPVLPLWVADMDLPCAKPILDALRRRVDHGIFGYSEKTSSYLDAVVQWMDERHQWLIDPSWILPTAGVVPDLYQLVRALISPGDRVLLQPPVYYPFYGAIEHGGGEIVNNPLRLEGTRYTMDFEDLENKISDPRLKLAILCSPHNPVGRLWSKKELQAFGELCSKHDVLVVADEIHGDLTLDGRRFIPFASISEAFAKNSVTCTAPSKTFNLAGLQNSNQIISNESVRTAVARFRSRNGLFGMNPLSIVACEAAYREGHDWLEQALVYIQSNRDFLVEYLDQYLPDLVVFPTEATYLVWMDFRRYGLDPDTLRDRMLNEANLYLDDGFIFGPEGEGFQRINIACPRVTLTAALDRLKSVFAR